MVLDMESAATEPLRERLRIIAYSDYVCPWCYIGLQRIEQLEREFPVAVEWRPFELHPETPKTGAQLAGRLGSRERARAYRDNIIMLAGESGLEMRMPGVVANSHLALEAAEFARDHGGFEAYHRALFRAYFEEGRDVGDAEVLCEIARACGVDDQGLRQALADEQYASRIDEITRRAREDEVLSTPTFVFETGVDGGFRLTGAQDYAVFASVTERILARRARADGAQQ
ncbi:MAG: DsbA family oxidoreductase [Chloroflexi bacterium]|nr:DsbA family oxidoreductase [Chloroflexota bacterium]